MNCEAILFADKAIQENTGKWGLIGIFDRFNLPQFPTPPLPVWFVYLAITEIEQGKHEFALNLLRESENQVIAPINGEMEVRNPGGRITLVLPIPGVSFPKPDRYSVVLHIGGSYVASKALDVIPVGTAPGG